MSGALRKSFVAVLWLAGTVVAAAAVATPSTPPPGPERAYGTSLSGVGAELVSARAGGPSAAHVGALPSVRLLSPNAHTDLIAGVTAELAWEPLSGYRELSAVVEWEAFLSLDGGATYPWRLTPHLDQDLRRIAFRVPVLPTPDARILLRFGDERRETAVELPQRFAIRIPAVPGSLSDPRLAPLPRAAATAGEAALPGQRGVVGWVEGSRRGTGLRQVVAAGAPALTATLTFSEAPPVLAVLSSESPAPEIAAARAVGPEVPPPPAVARASGEPPARPCPDLLLLTQRQNE